MYTYVIYIYIHTHLLYVCMCDFMLQHTYQNTLHHPSSAWFLDMGRSSLCHFCICMCLYIYTFVDDSIRRHFFSKQSKWLDLLSPLLSFFAMLASSVMAWTSKQTLLQCRPGQTGPHLFNVYLFWAAGWKSHLHALECMGAELLWKPCVLHLMPTTYLI